MTELNELTATFDILKKEFQGYESRPQQIEMAREVYTCLKENKKLLVEAGTGVGKSFAYLIPTILSGTKTVVSTASIALQDQLVNKDMVFLQKVLPQKFSYALLKGKNNYLCLKREREFGELGESYKKFREWAFTTQTGDKDELSSIPDFWQKVCGESDDCNSVQCPFFGSCFYYRHYRDIRKKDILVVNHHLLIYDLLSGFNLLPFHNQLIMDEAHQIENVISQASGSTLSHSRVLWLLYRLRGLKIAIDHLIAPLEAFFNPPIFPPLLKGEVKRGVSAQAVSPIPEAVTEGLVNLRRQLALDRVVHRLSAYKESASDDELNDRVETTINYIGSLSSVINDFIEQADGDKVYFLAGNKNTIELKSNLVESQGPFGSLVNGYESLVMTSATLTAGGDFGFIKNRLGIFDTNTTSKSTFAVIPARSESQRRVEPTCRESFPEEGLRTSRNDRQNGLTNDHLSNNNEGTAFKERVIGSPFAYKRQALLYLDRELPPPDGENSKTFYREGIKTIEGLINASRGRALVLFTSYNHLHFVSKNIRTDYPFKTQGDMPPARLIQWFKKTPNSVLLATATFWQGIDIRGNKLSLVIIAKIPFGSPGDPVYDERCRRLGERWFKDLALPSAILLLRQGFGRLIRGVDDYGVVAILDTRLVVRSYAKTIVSSLPGMDIVHHIDDVKKFFDSVPVCSENTPHPLPQAAGDSKFNRERNRGY